MYVSRRYGDDEREGGVSREATEGGDLEDAHAPHHHDYHRFLSSTFLINCTIRIAIFICVVMILYFGPGPSRG